MCILAGEACELGAWGVSPCGFSQPCELAVVPGRVWCERWAPASLTWARVSHRPAAPPPPPPAATAGSAVIRGGHAQPAADGHGQLRSRISPHLGPGLGRGPRRGATAVPGWTGAGGAWPWGPPHDAGRKLCGSGLLPAAPGLLVGRVSVARPPGKRVLQPRAPAPRAALGDQALTALWRPREGP